MDFIGRIVSTMRQFRACGKIAILASRYSQSEKCNACGNEKFRWANC